MASKRRAKIYPFLWYAKEAEEAARFYTSIFPDSRVDRVTPMQSESPSGPARLGEGRGLHALRPALPGHDRRAPPRVQRRHLDRRGVRRPGGARPLLERAARGRRQAAGLRMARSTGSACAGRSCLPS